MAAVALEGLDWMEGQTDVESKGQELGGTELFEILRGKKKRSKNSKRRLQVTGFSHLNHANGLQLASHSFQHQNW